MVGVTSRQAGAAPWARMIFLRIVSETLASLHAEIFFVGKTTSLPLALPKGSISLNATPWAEVWIDGEKVGETPIGNYAVTDRPHDIRVQEPRFLGEQHHAATVTAATPVKLSVD